ncbi:MAG TPA: VWA domain-containing protein [Vicinamibacteria bacterium]
MRLAPIAVAIVLAVVRSGSTQAQEPQKPELLVPVSAEVVRIDVIVTDKGGKARPGLKREDFQVLEDGRPQSLTQFEAFVAPAPAAAAPVAAAPAAASAEPGPVPQATPRRYVVLAVDDIHIEAANLMRVKKTLDRFLEREVPPEDMVALVTTSGARSQDFTADRQTIRQVVARLTLQDRRLRQVDVPFITEYQAELIERGDPEALSIAVEEIQARRPSPSAEAEARMVARAVLADSINSSRATLDTLKNVVRGMGELRGRKVVVFVSDGFTAGLGIENRAGYDLREITDAGTRSGVIVYSLDSRGLQANISTFNAANRGPVMTAGGAGIAAARDRLARAGEFASQDVMNAMAADTGGFLVANTNSFSDALRRIMNDTETYYLLAYEPTSASRDGAFRKIEVRLPGLKDMRIRHRKGYFGPGVRNEGVLASTAASGNAAGGSVPAREDRLRAELQAALASPKPLEDFKVSLSADFMSVDSAATQVVVSSYVALRDVPFARTGDRRLATVDVAGAVFDEGGAVVGSLAVERATLDLTDAAYEGALDKGLPYQRAAPLKPGRYRVSVAVREEGGGKMGSATQWVEIPDLGQGELTLSSLFLMKEDAAAKRAGASTGAGAGLRPVQAHRVYAQGESLIVQFFAYNLAPDAGSLVTQAEIWRAGELIAASKPEPMEKRDGGAAHTRRINLRPFGPGEYEVRIVLTDRDTNTTASRRAAFTIE